MKKIFIFFFLFAIINYMNAYVFKIGNFGVRWYSLLILIGVIVGILLIEKEGKKVDCRKLLALMGLGVKKGHEVTFTIEGADEEAAYEAVSKFMQENL